MNQSDKIKRIRELCEGDIPDLPEDSMDAGWDFAMDCIYGVLEVGEVKLKPRDQRRTPDMRWHPMRTAPKDGTVIEALCIKTRGASYSRILRFDTRSGRWWTMAGGTLVNAAAWRPAHPEWQEDPS